MIINKSPLAIFDTLEQISVTNASELEKQYLNNEDIIKAYSSYKTGSKGIFNAYRREVERLLHWCHSIANKLIKGLRREDIENFIKFC